MNHYTTGDVWLRRVTGWWRLLAAGLAERHPTSQREECELTARQTIELLLLLRLCQERGLVPPDALSACFGRRDLSSRLIQWLDWLEGQYGSAMCRVRHGGTRSFLPGPRSTCPTICWSRSYGSFPARTPWSSQQGRRFSGGPTSGSWTCGLPAATGRRRGPPASITRPSTFASTSWTGPWPTRPTLPAHSLTPPVAPGRSCWPPVAG